MFGELPDRHMIEALPAVMDQGSGDDGTSSCTGHAVAVVLFPTLGWIPSPAEIYRNGRAIDRPDPNIKLEDIGARPNEVFRAVNQHGVRPMQRSVHGRFSDADPATINDEPKLGDLQVEATNLLVGDYEIYSRGGQRGLEVRTALAAGKPIACAIAGGSSTFQNYKGGTLPPLRAPLDHYVALTGYERTHDGWRYRIRNSWSIGWGEAGDCWINSDGLDELGDVVVGDVRRL